MTGERVLVDRLPGCDFCPKGENPAIVDGKTQQGPWAYMCAEHFAMFGVGTGTGRGQKLALHQCVHCQTPITRGDDGWFHTVVVVGDTDPSKWHVPEPARSPLGGA